MRGDRPVCSGKVLSLGPITLRISVRVAVIVSLLMGVVLLLGVVSLMYGTLKYGPGEVFGGLFGFGEERIVRTVRGRRLPRLLTALLVGGSLGVAGALFQNVSRNALGSPEVIGFTAGAATGAVLQVAIWNGNMAAVVLSAVAGGTVTALLVYTLARRNGVSGGLRLVLVGIGIGAIASALTQLILVRSALENAVSAQQWLAGSLLSRTWAHVAGVGITCLVVAIPLVLVARRLSIMAMGDDLALGLGINAERVRMGAVALGVLLTSTAVAATGPLSFVALAAPQIVTRLYRRSGFHVAGSFLLGAVILAFADYLSQSISIGLRTPVGTLTALLGGIYLAWLLWRRV